MAKKSPDDLTLGPLLKVRRAKQHINDLSAAIDAFLAERPYRLMLRQSPKTRDQVLFVKTDKPVPDEFALILGDAVHNLRTALDLLVFGMVGDDAPSPERVLFPFAKNAQALGSTIPNRQMHVASKEVIDALHALKPYPGGDDLLSGLHLVDVRDKHHLILTVGRVVSISTGLLAHYGLNITGDGIINFVGAGDEVIRFKLPTARRNRGMIPKVEQESEVQPAFTVCFGEGETFAGQPVVPKLGEMVGSVENAINLLVEAYLR